MEKISIMQQPQAGWISVGLQNSEDTLTLQSPEVLDGPFN